MATRTHTEFNVEAQKVKWDPKTIEIRTRSVEKTLEPLVLQVTSLVNHQRKKTKSGKSKKAHQLAKEIDEAAKRLVVVGEGIANDFPEIRDAMFDACKDAKESGKELATSYQSYAAEILALGKEMHVAAKDFSDDPCNNGKRNVVIRAARALLSSVTRLLCIADMADVYRLLATLRLVEDRLRDLQTVENSDALLMSFKNYGEDLMQLAKLTGLRQADLKDSRRKDEMAAARATLKKSSRMLLTTSKAFVNHPDVASAKRNRDYVMHQVTEAVRIISGVALASGGSDPHPFEEAGALAKALENLLKCINMKPSDFNKKETQFELERQLEEILNGAARLADSSCTRDTTRDRIIAECNNVKQALQHLLNEYMKHSKGKPNEVPGAREEMNKKTKDLSKQLRKAVVDHVSDSFLETNVPLMLLIEAAQAGNEKEVEECAVVFTEHAAKLEEVAGLACSMSNNSEGVKMVRVASRQLHSLCPQVINAARTLAARPLSKVAKENMDVFRDAWIQQVRVLTEAVDDITTIDDFLAVSEAHILEDVNRCVEAMRQSDAETLDRTAGAVRGRIARVDNVVTAEMDNYEPGPYTETVRRAVLMMRDNIMPQFAEQIDVVVDALNNGALADIDDNMFIDASLLVYEGVRDIRKAVQMRKRDDELDTDDDEQDTQKSTLLISLADAQAKQREKAAYEQLKAGGKVQFEIHSEGANDASPTGHSSIVVNGSEYAPKRRGHNVVILDEIGNVVSSRVFDTTDPKQGAAMATYLDEIPDDHIALIAVQETTGSDVRNTEKAMQRLGADNINPGVHGSYAFAGYKGDYNSKNWVTSVSRPQNAGPAMISDMINTPAADQGKVKVEITSQGADDTAYGRICSIKVNGVERSPFMRGFNIVVLDNAGNFLLSKSFDTVDVSHGETESWRMTRFLNELPSERMICVATMETPGELHESALEALISVGAESPVSQGKNSSYAMIGYTGPLKATWVKQVNKSRREGPAKIVQFVVTPAAEDKRSRVQEEEISSEYEPRAFTENDDYEDAPIDLEESNKTLTKRSARSLMRALPAAEKAKIAKLTEGLRMEKSLLVREVSKWDDQGNDIVVMAKKMCMIMMDMSDFTRGTGPLKTTIDVCKAAERIAKYGADLNKLAGLVAEKCPHSSTRNDLLAYLQRIALYSHQLTITARVKADVQMISGELVVSGLDSATSLIQAAKNLMNSVILTVKYSYIATTKHRHTGATPIVTWHMKAPDMKPLFNVNNNEQRRTVRHTEVDTDISPIQALSEFDTK